MACLQRLRLIADTTTDHEAIEQTELLDPVALPYIEQVEPPKAIDAPLNPSMRGGDDHAKLVDIIPEMLVHGIALLLAYAFSMRNEQSVLPSLTHTISISGNVCFSRRSKQRGSHSSTLYTGTMILTLGFIGLFIHLRPLKCGVNLQNKRECVVNFVYHYEGCGRTQEKINVTLPHTCNARLVT